MVLTEKMEQAVSYIRSLTDVEPSIGLILGSGLGDLGNDIEQAITIPYQDIPHFVKSTVQTHKGQFVIGQLEGKAVIAMQGRLHYYEGHSMEAVTFPIRVMRALGVKQLIVTNSSGGIHPDYKAGDMMVISDHINLLGSNPLIGPNEESLGVRFPDMSEAYSARLRTLAHEAAASIQVKLQEGVYVACTGPSFETPAEIRMMARLGGDAVGMSTVPEVIVARHAGIEILALSCVCNLAAGISPQPLTAEEVFEAADQLTGTLTKLVKTILRGL